MNKKKILVYWDYRRKDLLYPFYRLSEETDFIFLFFRNPEEDPVEELPFQKVYWADFDSPYELLDRLKPCKVVFSDFSNINVIALNIAAKNKGLQTIILDHGAKADISYYQYLIRKNQKPARDVSTAAAGNQTAGGSRKKTLKFYFSVLKPVNIGSFIHILQLFWRFYRSNSERALATTRFRLRKASRYLLFSVQNLQYWEQFDGVDEKKDVTYVGNPHLDNLVQLQSAGNTDNYYLLLDEGIIEVSFDITLEQKNAFTLKLNEYCISKGAKLFVKLHPFDYERTDLVQHPNITYIKAANISELVQGARGCFGISSTLVIPLIPQKRILLFKIDNNPFQDELYRYSPSIFLDYNQFLPEDIRFEQITFDNEKLDAFIYKFLYKNDGRSLERIREAMNS